MDSDTVVTIPDIPVMYVAGEAGRPIPEQAQAAFPALEAKLPTLKNRRFYGVGVGEQYRACVAIDDERDDPDALPHPRWTIPGGRYVRRRIADWESNPDRIKPTFDALRARPDFDPSRPWIEFYRSRRELLVMVPVR
jgi:hypothetical protein